MMYCANCGAEAPFGIKFCKRCGAALAAATSMMEPPRPIKMTGMFWAVATFGIISVVMLLVTLMVMAGVRADENIAIPTAIFGSAAIVTIAAMLIRQLSRVIKMSQGQAEPPQQRLGPPPRYTGAPPPQQQQQQIPPSGYSVTEHTTRNFDPAPYREPGTRE